MRLISVIYVSSAISLAAAAPWWMWADVVMEDSNPSVSSRSGSDVSVELLSGRVADAT
ncbi:hypothetical protein B0H19DRAFT_1268146 [Mycena capillaripes]|nr:hypothetical protein B0H19DRAFT_1268146 [Mycena capillaripes]